MRPADEKVCGTLATGLDQRLQRYWTIVQEEGEELMLGKQR